MAAPKRHGLGRGLGALIPNTEPLPTTPASEQPAARPVDVFFPRTPGTERSELSPTVKAAKAAAAPKVSRETRPTANNSAGQELIDVPGAYFTLIPINEIEPNTKQPRQFFDEDALDELAASIKEMGVLQPIIVRERRVKSGSKPHFELIMGERRWRASAKAGLDTVPAIVRQTADADMLRDALLENLHRANLNPLEEAAAYQQLLDDFSITQEELAGRIARSRPQISNTLRLLKLPVVVQRRVAAGVLSAGHARALLALDDVDGMERLAERIVSEGLSVRAVEEIVSLGGVPKEKPAKHAPRAGGRLEAVDNLQDRLSDRFDTRVTVALGKKRGKVSIEFASVQDLNRILEVLAPGDPGLLK